MINDTIEYAARLGDDALIHGHRLSEWVSRGPFLEEDLALANVSLDYIGRARMFYGYAAECWGYGKTEDDFAYTRDEREFRNLLIYELPRGDFAFTMVRQFLVDVYHLGFLDALTHSSDNTLSAIAEKAIKETRYHLRRSKEWVLRLGDGTAQSHQRSQQALDEIWGYTIEMFEPDTLEQRLVENGTAVEVSALKAPWLEQVTTTLKQATLRLPEEQWAVRGGREGYHTENLGHILTEMQSVTRGMPGLRW